MQQSRSRGLLVVVLLGIAALALSACGTNATAPTQSWSGPTVANGVVYVGTREGSVVALDAANGFERQRFDAERGGRNATQPAFYGSPTVHGDHVYAAGYQGVVYQLDAVTMAQRRRFEIEGSDLSKGIAGAPVVAGDKLVVAAAEDVEDGRLYILEAETMALACRYPSADPIRKVWSTPAVVDGIAYFGDLGGNVHAVRVDNCSSAWPAPAKLGGAVMATPLVLNGKVYAGSFDRKFHEIDAANGQATELFNAGSWFWATPATDGTFIYAPTIDGVVRAWHIAERRVAWTYLANGDGIPIFAAPALAGNLLVLGMDARSVVVLDSATGAVTGTRRIGSDVRAPLASAGDVVYIHSLDNYVRAVQVPSLQLVWERKLES